MASLRYLGHSAFQLDLSHRTLLFDAWLDPHPKEMERLVAPALTEDKIRHADVIFLSHEHFDHCSPFDVNSIVQRTFCQVVAPEETLAKLNVPPRSKVVVNEGDSFSLMGIDVQVTKAIHPQCTHPVGFIISAEGKKVYFAGDTYDFFGMSDIDVDVALLPIGGTFTMDVFSAIKALKQMRAKTVVPMHYDTFSKIRADVRDFALRVKNSTKSSCAILSVGQTMEF